jgi:uncharacterized protein with beta-barrel porin domain
MKINLRLPFLIAAAVALSLSRAGAQVTVTFDDLPAPGATFLPIPAGYNGFQFSSNLTYFDPTTNTQGFNNPVSSPPNGALIIGGQSTITRATPFTFNSVFVTSEGISPLTLEVQGLNGATLKFDQTITYGTTPTQFTFDYTDITEIQFLANDFTALDNFVFTFGTNFAATPNLTPNQRSIAANIDTNSGAPGRNLNNVIVALQGLSPSALPAAFDQLSPQKFGQFTSITAFNNASFTTEQMDQYLAEQRAGPNGTFTGGNGTIDTSGLTVNDPSYDPNLAMVHSRLMAWNAGPVDGTVTDVASPLGGVEMKDSKDMKSMAPTGPAYDNPWNFFVQGNVILAQGFSQTDVPHFDDNTESVLLGVDYRVTPNILVGLTAAYGHTDATLDTDGSSATIDSYSPGFYASYADKGWYANLSGYYSHNAYTQDRVIGFLGQTATSAPEGNEGVANLDGGYEFHHGALTYGPLVGIQYTHLSLDGYNEGGSDADLTVNSQDSDSLRSRLGGRISYAFNGCGVTFRPHLDASWQHEFLDQSRGIDSQFTGAVGGFTVRTVDPSRDSALMDAGLDAEVSRTVTVFADYEAQAGQENYFGQSVQAGVKFGF